MKNAKRIPLQKLIWCKIRYYQQTHEITNASLADIMTVGERTLRVYDKNAGKVTLDKIDNFLDYNGISITELMSQ